MEETTCRFSNSSSSSSCSLLQLSHEEENCFKSALAFVVLRRRLLPSTKRPAPNESCTATDIAIDTTGTVVHVDDTTNTNNNIPKRTEDNKHGGSCSLFSGILPSLTSPSKWPPVVPLQQQYHHHRHRQRQQQHYHHLEDMMRVAITTAMSLYKDDDDDREDNDCDDHTNHPRRVVRHGWIYDYKQAAAIPTTNHHSNHPTSVYGTMNGLVLHLALQLRSMLVVQQDTHHTNDTTTTTTTNNNNTNNNNKNDRGTARNDPTEMCQWLLTWMKRTLVPWASPDNHANHPDNVTDNNNNNNNNNHHPDNDETEERTETSTSSNHSSNSENHPSPHHQQNHQPQQRQCNTERQTTTRTRTAKQLLATCTVWHRIAIVVCQPHNPPTGTTNSSNSSNSTNHTVTGMLMETIGSILRDLHEDKLDCSLLNSSSRGTSESWGGGWSLSDVLAVNLIHLLEGMIPALLRIGHAPQWRRQIIQTTYPSSNTYEKEPSLSLLLPNEQQQAVAWAVQQQLQQALDPLWLPIPITEQAHVYYSNQHCNRNRNLRHPHQHPHHQQHNHHHNQHQHHERCCYLTGGAKLMLRMALYDSVQKLSLLSSSSTPPLLHTYPTKTTVSPRSTTTTAPYSISTNTEHAGIVTGEY